MSSILYFVIYLGLGVCTAEACRYGKSWWGACDYLGMVALFPLWWLFHVIMWVHPNGRMGRSDTDTGVDPSSPINGSLECLKNAVLPTAIIWALIILVVGYALR